MSGFWSKMLANFGKFENYYFLFLMGGLGTSQFKVLVAVA